MDPWSVTQHEDRHAEAAASGFMGGVPGTSRMGPPLSLSVLQLWVGKPLDFDNIQQVAVQPGLLDQDGRILILTLEWVTRAP